MRYLLALLLLPLAVSGAVMVGPNGTGGAYTFGTTTFTTVTNVPDPLTNGTIVVTQALSAPSLTLGVGASTGTVTATNGPALNGYPLLYWSEFIDYNTNQLFMTGFYQAGGNTSYGWSGWALTNGANNRWFTNIAGYWNYCFNGTLLMTNSVNLTSTNTWGSISGGTNVPCITIFGTNAVYGMIARGGLTNMVPACTNGAGGHYYSNGVERAITSKVGSTSQSNIVVQLSP